MLAELSHNHVKHSLLLLLVPNKHLLHPTKLSLHASELFRTIQDSCQDWAKQVVLLRVDVDGELAVVQVEGPLIGLVVGFEEGDGDAARYDAAPHAQGLLCDPWRANTEDGVPHVFMSPCHSLPACK